MTPHYRETGHDYAPRGDGFCRTCGREGPKERARRLASLTAAQLAIAREADGANRGKFQSAATDTTFRMVDTVRHGLDAHLSRDLTSWRLGEYSAQALLRSAIASGSDQLIVLRALGEVVAREYAQPLRREAALEAICAGLGVAR